MGNNSLKELEGEYKNMYEKIKLVNESIDKIEIFDNMVKECDNLNKKIKQQESEIKQLKIDIRSANTERTIALEILAKTQFGICECCDGRGIVEIN